MRFLPPFKHFRFIKEVLQEPSTRSPEELIAGRRYRIDVPYALPKDLQETNRLDFQHYALRALLKGNALTPLRVLTPRHILDVGCGTGRWCRDLANEQPQASITGLDLEAQWPTGIALPPTIHFVQANLLAGLPFAEGAFEYVHQRLLVAAIPAASWPFVLRELVRVTRRGGWIELLEAGRFERMGEATHQLVQWGEQVGQRLGFDLALMEHLGDLLAQAGASVVETRHTPVPLGTWGGHIGDLLAVDVHAALKSCQGLYSSQLGISSARFDAVVSQLTQEWERHQTTYTFHIVLGTKP
jgi:SAM-dependent methyltransferase